MIDKKEVIALRKSQIRICEACECITIYYNLEEEFVVHSKKIERK